MTFSTYCEIASINGLLEPLNFISNFAFIIAALALYLHFKKNNIKDKGPSWFITITFLIGIGSFSWHLYRHTITNLLDTIPIAVFMISLGYVYSLKAFKEKKKVLTFIILGTIIGLMTRLFLEQSPLPPVLQNNGISYFVISLLFLIPIIKSKRISKEYFKKGILLFFLFMIALFFRQIDLLICQNIPLGSHFLWHITNSFIIYYAVKLLYQQPTKL